MISSSDPNYYSDKYRKRYIRNISKLSGVSGDDVEKVLKAYSELFLHEIAIYNNRERMNLCFPSIGKVLVTKNPRKEKEVAIKVIPDEDAMERINNAFYNQHDYLVEDLVEKFKNKVGSIVLAATSGEDLGNDE